MTGDTQKANTEAGGKIMDYKNAGVDIEAGYKSVELIKKHVQSTMRPEVLTNLGGFSGAFSMKAFQKMENPTLVSGTDGVGTKLKLAFLMDKHDTVGIDCVSTILHVQAANRCFFWIISHVAKIILRKSKRLSAVWQKDAGRRARR